MYSYLLTYLQTHLLSHYNILYIVLYRGLLFLDVSEIYNFPVDCFTFINTMFRISVTRQNGLFPRFSNYVRLFFYILCRANSG